MIKNGRDIANGTELSTQVCVIGSGPAGVTAAWILHKAGIKVILIEGSREFPTMEESWPDKVRLYNGESVGLFATNEPEFLIQPYSQHQPNPAWERERYYGGTSAHWGGQSRPEDPIDLEKRPGPPSFPDFPGWPGWPVTRPQLDDYYDQASTLCYLNGKFNPDGTNFSNPYWETMLNAQAPALTGFDTEMYQFVGPSYRNFATREFEGQPIGNYVDVILNASLLDIENQQGNVTRLRVASMDKDLTDPQKATEFTIKADAYVLACGAVANARQLLLSNIGNEHDQVGRYFMCHPLSQSQVVSAWGYLNDSESRFMAGHVANNSPWTDTNGVRVNARFIPSADTTRSLGIGRCWFWAGGGQYYYEPAPNPDSRITLSDTTDPVFGQPQTHIDWQLSPVDEYTYNQTTALFQTAVTERGGDVYFASWDSVKSQLIVNGHHIGTTRMSDDPANGVVDANLKVHSVGNLYVAGSSVFSSAGISNPTFTIITLSVRLAEYLTGVL